MPIPYISGSVLLAAACGSATAFALHRAHLNYLNSGDQLNRKHENAIDDRAGQEKNEQGGMEEILWNVRDDRVVQENLRQRRERLKRNIRANASEPKGRTNDSAKKESSEVTNGGNEETVAREVEGNVVANEPKAVENTEVKDYEKSTATERVETRDQGTAAEPATVESEAAKPEETKSETADKGISTDESGYCKGDEDIVLVDRRLMQLMVQSMAEMESKLLKYEGGSNEQISLLQQLFH